MGDEQGDQSVDRYRRACVDGTAGLGLRVRSLHWRLLPLLWLLSVRVSVRTVLFLSAADLSVSAGPTTDVRQPTAIPTAAWNAGGGALCVTQDRRLPRERARAAEDSDRGGPDRVADDRSQVVDFQPDRFDPHI